MSTLKAQAHAEKFGLKDKLTVNAKTGTIDVSDDYYEATLPEGLTLEQVKKLQKHNQEVLSGTVLAAGELARDHFRENGESKELSLSYKVGYMEQDLFFNRSPEKGEESVRAVASWKEPNRADTNKAMKAVQELFDAI
jgi:hypothetical protein